MASWSKKLECVDGEGLSRTSGAKVGHSHAQPEELAHVECDRAARSTPPCNSGHTSTTSVLDALRDRMARMVHPNGGSTSTAQPVAADDSHEPRFDLGFATTQQPSGVLHSRQRWFHAHRVGRAPVGMGATASMQMIALLALDPSLSALDPRRALYFDVETSGLATGTGTLAFLVGLGYFARADDGEPGASGGPFVVEQLFLRQPGEEAALLSRIATLMQEASMLVSYNGKAFDLPLYRTRCVMNRLPAPPPKPHLDLLHIARRVHSHRLAHRALAHIESEVLGFGRVDDVASDEIPARYFHFLRSGDEAPIVPVVDHNVLDVLSMAALLGVYGEPLEGLSPVDLVGIARTVGRARSFELAQGIAECAVDRGAGAEAIRVRGEIARTRGDKARALADFESLVDTVDDPEIRLALAKLYEHHAKEPLRALQMLALGTSEPAAAHEHRRRRLLRKVKARGGRGDGTAGP